MYTEKVIIVTTDEKIFSKDFKGSDIEYLASLINAEKLSFFEADPKRTTIKIWDKNGQPDELTFSVFFDKNQEKCNKINALIGVGILNHPGSLVYTITSSSFSSSCSNFISTSESYTT